MKKVIVFILLLTVVAFAQQKVEVLNVTQPEFITVTLDSTASSIVYYIYPPPAGINSSNRTEISTSSPTSDSVQARNLEFSANGALTIAIVTDSSTAEESDSLNVYVQTLIYDQTKTTWYKSVNDTLFLDFDTPGTYTGTSADYLDWTHGGCYTANLGGEIMPGAGLAITFSQVANDNADAASSIYVSFWWQK